MKRILLLILASMEKERNEEEPGRRWRYAFFISGEKLSEESLQRLLLFLHSFERLCLVILAWMRCWSDRGRAEMSWVKISSFYVLYDLAQSLFVIDACVSFVVRCNQFL